MVSNGLTETQIGKMGLKKKDGPIGKALEWSQLENLLIWAYRWLFGGSDGAPLGCRWLGFSP